jgi:hypothetical protein
MSVFAEVVVILLHYLRAIGGASGGSLFGLAAGPYGWKTVRDNSCEGKSAQEHPHQEEEATANLGQIRGHEIRSMYEICERHDDSEVSQSLGSKTKEEIALILLEENASERLRFVRAMKLIL